MNNRSMRSLDVLAVLMNGGHVVRREPSVSGRTVFKVMLPGGCNPDKCVGHFSVSVFDSLAKAGFLTPIAPQRRSDGYILTWYELSKPKLPFFSLDKEVPGND